MDQNKEILYDNVFYVTKLHDNKYLLRLTDNKINILNKFGTIFNKNYTIEGDIKDMPILKLSPIGTKFNLLFWSPMLDYKHDGILFMLSELFEYVNNVNVIDT